MEENYPLQTKNTAAWLDKAVGNSVMGQQIDKASTDDLSMSLALRCEFKLNITPAGSRTCSFRLMPTCSQAANAEAVDLPL